MAENIAEQTDSNEQSVNWEERAKKAEAKIVDLKKQDESKAEPEEKTEETKTGYSKEELDKAIKEALKEQAIENQNKQYEENIKETNSSTIGDEDPVIGGSGFEKVSGDAYDKMTPTQQKNYYKESVAQIGYLMFE